MVARSASNTKCHTLIIWYHLSVVWCLEMVDSCCPSNVESVKKFCEYRISEILLFSLFDILIFCKKTSWNCFLLLCEKVQQTYIITSLYPLLPQVIEPHQEKNYKTNLTAREFVTVDPEYDRMIGCTELA